MPKRSVGWIVGMAILTMVNIFDVTFSVVAWVAPGAVVHRPKNNSGPKSASRWIAPHNHAHHSALCMAEKGISEETSPSPMSFLETTEWSIIENLHEEASKKAADNDKEMSFQDAAEELLPALSPGLIMKLRTGEDLVPPGASDDKDNDRLLKIFAEVSKALNTMTDRRLESARDTLRELMNAGEIKKLDAIIGKSARNQKLDVAFFQVLQMNMRDAAEEAQKATASGDEENSSAVDRFQILQHIYTRCQEEVEKVINPGTALLNKLLRTEVDSIRRNQLNHYLCPKPTTIKDPNGKEIVLNNGQPMKPLVAHPDFCDAIGNAVKQIRTVEKSGATTPEVAADLVETIRTVAKEARFTIGEHFGGNSTEVIAFEEALEPVFRPTSPDSVYIQGEQ